MQPLVFFAIVTTLFPLAISPELSRLRDIAPGVLWVAALLSSQLALEFLFRDDAHDGTLEQYALAGQSLTGLPFAKTVAHWLLTGLPLALMAPLGGLSLGVPAAAVPGIVVSVSVGSMALSLIGSVGAALTLGAGRRSGALLSLLTLPLAVPVLIFGARATELAIKGESFSAPLQLLGALTVLGLTFGASWRLPPRCGSTWSSERSMAWTWFHRLGSPPYIYNLAARLTPWFAWPAALLILGGLYGGLVLAPADYQQGDGFRRIIYVPTRPAHGCFPCSWCM